MTATGSGLVVFRLLQLVASSSVIKIAVFDCNTTSLLAVLLLLLRDGGGLRRRFLRALGIGFGLLLHLADLLDAEASRR
ncbi:hypothetical protein [Candidatus Pantoea persica]|uniref:hypothetical protein n=1 Tax=Candidatus Pantoea persica TaxID=2518128 RepID=UPI00215D8DB7|nr:hypothetical protein [Candidatus Pantoea persica]